MRNYDDFFHFVGDAKNDPKHAQVPSTVLKDWNPWEEDELAEEINTQQRRDAFKEQLDLIAKSRPKRYKVQIWGKAAIGNQRIYLQNMNNIYKVNNVLQWLIQSTI